jgi:hypothetical protein
MACDPADPVPPPLGDLAGGIVEDGLRRYFADRRARVDGFVDRHFSASGSLRLHRAALGWDVLRAPANILLAGPNVALQAGQAIARRAGWRTPPRHLLLHTAVGRRIEYLVVTDLLELPWPGEPDGRNALAAAILADPRIAAAMRQAWAEGDAPRRARLQAAIATYAGTRAAAAEITTSLATLGAGAVAVKQVTPGVVMLGPVLAASLAQQAAINGFPLGTGLGSLWYGLFPVAPSLTLVVGLTGGLMLGASSLAAFAGLLADPVQRRLGLHRRRLLRLLDALERQWLDPSAPDFTVRDHYVARLVDLLNLLGTALRIAGA